MKKSRVSMIVLFVVMAAGAVRAEDKAFVDKFDVDEKNFVSSGRNKYFILEPGFQWEYADDDEKLVITVLDETKKVGNVETRIIEERESKDGKLVEVSRNYFAIDKTTNNVYYFGEDVDMYKDGKVTNHEGSWLAGTNGAKYGLVMPADPKVGDRYYQEIAPGVALDRFEVKSITESKKTPAGKFEHVLKTEETSGLNPKEKEYKYYAPDVGQIIDGGQKLVKYGQTKK
jgi:hypothetical protein